MDNQINTADGLANDDDDREFWMAASRISMARIWDNPEDDVYAELLSGPNSTETISVPGDSAESPAVG
jgi:hypothetical protein